MARVTISSPLRRFCDNKDSLDGNGITVLEVILKATQNYPELKKKVLKSDTEIHSQVMVYINGTILQSPREDVSVDAETEINLLLIVGGG
jgi:hypothetical protein